jgi:hypothetical protein
MKAEGSGQGGSAAGQLSTERVCNCLAAPVGRREEEGNRGTGNVGREEGRPVAERSRSTGPSTTLRDRWAVGREEGERGTGNREQGKPVTEPVEVTGERGK